MVNDELAILFRGLAAARMDGSPWHASARLLQRWIEDQRGWPQMHEVWDQVDGAAGVSAVMLKRYIRTFRMILDLAGKEGRPAEELLPPGFTAAELAVRLHERDPKEGLKMLAALRARQATIEDVRKQLETTPSRDDFSERGKIFEWRRRTTEICDAALRKAAVRLFGQGTSIGGRPPRPPLPNIGYEIRTPDGEISAGADLYLGETPGGGADPLEDLCGSAVLSGLLPTFWVILAPTFSETAVSYAVQALAAMAPDAGVLRISTDGKIATIRKAAAGTGRAAAYAELIASLSGRRS